MHWPGRHHPCAGQFIKHRCQKLPDYARFLGQPHQPVQRWTERRSGELTVFKPSLNQSQAFCCSCVEINCRGDGCLVSVRASVIRSNISRVPSASASCQACPAQNFHSFSWYSLVRCHSLQQRGQRVVEFEWLQQQSRRAASCHPDTVRRVRNTDRQRHQLHA